MLRCSSDRTAELEAEAEADLVEEVAEAEEVAEVAARLQSPWLRSQLVMPRTLAMLRLAAAGELWS
jgi:hypothetical protein